MHAGRHRGQYLDVHRLPPARRSRRDHRDRRHGFPSLVIITIIAAFIQQFAHLAVVQHAFAGIRIAVCALVLQSVWKMAKKGVVDIPTGVILVVTFAAVAFFGVSPVLMVVIAAAAGILINVVRGRRA